MTTQQLLADLVQSERVSAARWRQIAADALRMDDLPRACFAHSLAVEREEQAEHDAKEVAI